MCLCICMRKRTHPSTSGTRVRISRTIAVKLSASAATLVSVEFCRRKNYHRYVRTSNRSVSTLQQMGNYMNYTSRACASPASGVTALAAACSATGLARIESRILTGCLTSAFIAAFALAVSKLGFDSPVDLLLLAAYDTPNTATTTQN